jgi:hypothetical protein
MHCLKVRNELLYGGAYVLIVVALLKSSVHEASPQRSVKAGRDGLA